MTEKRFSGVSSFFLHILAMGLMVCDHLWATMLPGQQWLTCIGRGAFPIFAFLIAEGYYRTSNVKRYTRRMLVFAILSEVPFNLFYGSSLVYPFHQNVLWTFFMALCSIGVIERARATKNWWVIIPMSIVTVAVSFLLGTITMVDYLGAGVLTVLVFYCFRGRNIWCFLGQFTCLWLLNVQVLGGFYYPVTILGHEVQIVQQGFALLALIPIWLYRGRQGYHSKIWQYACYAFYPVHLLVLYGLWQLAA